MKKPSSRPQEEDPSVLSLSDLSKDVRLGEIVRNVERILTSIENLRHAIEIELSPEAAWQRNKESNEQKISNHAQTLERLYEEHGAVVLYVLLSHEKTWRPLLLSNSGYWQWYKDAVVARARAATGEEVREQIRKRRSTRSEGEAWVRRREAAPKYGQARNHRTVAKRLAKALAEQEERLVKSHWTREKARKQALHDVLEEWESTRRSPDRKAILSELKKILAIN